MLKYMNILQNFNEKAQVHSQSVEKTQLLALFIIKLAFSERVFFQNYMP